MPVNEKLVAELPWYERSLSFLSGRDKNSNDVGIEIEAEFKEGFLFPEDREQFLWVLKADGSLRGTSCEFVLPHPIKIGQLGKYLQNFEMFTGKWPFRFSARCSTHVHVNMLGNNPEEIFAICLLWWCLEAAIVSTQGSTRVGNLFALRAKDAIGNIQIMENLHRMQWLRLRDLRQIGQRYATLNLMALHQFGSLEFRFLRGMKDTAEIGSWVRFLHELTERGKQFTIRELQEAISDHQWMYLWDRATRGYHHLFADVTSNWGKIADELSLPLLAAIQTFLVYKNQEVPKKYRYYHFLEQHEDLPPADAPVPKYSLRAQTQGAVQGAQPQLNAGAVNRGAWPGLWVQEDLERLGNPDLAQVVARVREVEANLAAQDIPDQPMAEDDFFARPDREE